MIRAIFILFLCPFLMSANDLSITDLSMVDNSLTFNISWQNSWQYEDSIAPSNHDAVWVFVKAKSRMDGEWQHIGVSVDGHSAASTLSVLPSNSATGCIVKRTGNGEGVIDDIAISLSLNTSNIQDEYSELKVFGIEMVYVNQGLFYLGDSSSNNTLNTFENGMPYLINSEASISVGESDGDLWSKDDFRPFGDVPSAFPKGFNGFYQMKYEISQQLYADFLNTLSSGQVQFATLSTNIEAPCFAGDHIDEERNFIKQVDGVFGCDANGNNIFNEEDDGQNVGCGFLTWSNFTSFLDWSGLRPMTELEFEKSCRGSQTSQALEYAWGTKEVVNTKYLGQLNTSTEVVLDTIPNEHGIANYGYCLPSGPLRCGFAATSNSNRITSGASYFGAMNMSGNLWELCVVLTEQGLNFTGEHGDGQLDEEGYANVSHWDAIIGDAGGFRGGGWNSGILAEFRDLAVSDRFFVYLNPNSLARGTTGGRGVISIDQFE